MFTNFLNNLPQTRKDLFTIARRYDAARLQHTHVRHRASQIIFS